MIELVRFASNSNQPIIVQMDDSEPGIGLATRHGPILEAKKRFEEALQDVEGAAETVLRIFREGRLRPDGLEVEFGVRLNAEFGAVIAKTAMEGHFVVRLVWSATDANVDHAS